MRTRTKKFLLLMFLAMLVFIPLGGAVVRLLWNWLLPPLFGWPRITIWQGLGLLALCRILFGGFGFHRSGRRSGWRMTPEERERFRQGMTDVTCAVCGKPISKNESRYVDIDPGTNAKVYVHTACRK